MRFIAALLSGLWLVFAPSFVQAADTVTLPNCLLALDEEAQIPAQEAGVLQKILVREGQRVSEKELLAQIDDTIPRLQELVAGYKLDVARKQATDDIDRRFAEASAKVAWAEVQQAKESNQKVEHVVPAAEVRRRVLEHEKMVLSIEKAEKDLAVNALQAKVAQGELDAAKANMERRQLVAPLDAVVVELTSHVGEWVQVGQPVMRLVRMDRLRVEGFLNAKNFRPFEIQDRPVTVVVTLAHGQRETFPGKIVYVKPLIEAGGEFMVRAEVQNREENGAWVLSPGLNAEMTIQLK
jgi:multidrug efflux pump subunit AcrA (membrane-fusion protein)